MSVALAALLACNLSTVDARVQQAVDRAAQGAEAVLVVDVASGRVLAQAGAIDRPLPPASTFKIVDTIAAARRKPELLGRTARCAGKAEQAGVTTLCGGPPDGHGTLDLEEALAQSCNIYFGEYGAVLGTRALTDEARRLGVGVAPGHLPADGEPAPHVADGSGVRMTPRQYAGLLRAVALGRAPDGQPLVDDPTALGRLRSGLRAVVEHGTATTAKSVVPVAGKTGTSEFGAGSVGWFGGYAPADAPTVIVVAAKRGARGHDVAALVPPIFDAWFRGVASSSTNRR